MFEKMKDMMGNMQMIQQMMKDENFKAFISHPKVQELFRDAEFKDIAKSRDFSKIMAHPKFTALMRDPEVAPLLAKVNPQTLFGGNAAKIAS